jgi:phosphatidate cytidylyltransferase
MLVGAYLAGHTGQVLGVALLLAGAVLARLFDGQRTDVVRTLSTTLLFGLWIGFLASFAVLLVDRPDGIVVVLAVVASAIVTDVGGYAFGVTIGRHRIAPSISPNKTWEGFLGGVGLSVVIAALLLPQFGDTFTWQTAALIAAVCGVASFVGDLTESMVKRDLGLKDLGDVLPGHGGVLDRVDGILFALPVGYAVLAVLP